MKKLVLITLLGLICILECLSPCLAKDEHPFRCGTVGVAKDRIADLDWYSIRENNKSRSAAPMPEYNVGDTRLFWVWDLAVMPPVDIQIPVTCRAKGDFCYIWVSDEEWGDPVTEEDVDGVFTVWEEQTPLESMNPSMGIYEIATTTFGAAPDELDNDVRIHILFFDIGSFQGFTFDGYFNAYDQMTDTEAQANGYRSNECEILYLDCDPSDPDDPYMLGVLAHEFQHMIHWNHDQNETAWVDEGCSQLNWFLCGFGTDGAERNFANHPNNDLTSWDQTTSDYGQVTLFMLYLFEHYGGIPSIQSIVHHTGNSFQGIKHGLLELGWFFDEKQIMSEWAIANILDDPDLDHGQYGYSRFDPPSFNIAETFSSYPVSTEESSLNNWAAGYYRFDSGNGRQLNVDFIEENSDISVFLADSSRVIPVQNGYPGQLASFETADFIIVNHQSDISPTDFSFSATNESSTDNSPPYVLESHPWGKSITNSMAVIKLRDEFSHLDNFNVTIMGDPPTMEPILEPGFSGGFNVYLSLEGLPLSVIIEIVVEVSDTNGIAMQPFHQYFNLAMQETSDLGLRLEMPFNEYRPGLPCYLDAYISNPGDPKTAVPLIIILDVFGSYYSAPR